MRMERGGVGGEGQEEAREGVAGRLGKGYMPDATAAYKDKKSAQEAHEAVRPSSVAREPKAVARFLSKDQLALYRIIWERFLASQMRPAVYDTVAADIVAGARLVRAQVAAPRFTRLSPGYVTAPQVAHTGPQQAAEA